MTNHNQGIKGLHKEMPGVIDAFTALHDEVIKEGAISVKHKRLTMVAISVNIRCEVCLRMHVGAAIAAGATRQEIIETAQLGMLMSGGPGVGFSATHLVELLNVLKAGD